MAFILSILFFYHFSASSSGVCFRKYFFIIKLDYSCCVFQTSLYPLVHDQKTKFFKSGLYPSFLRLRSSTYFILLLLIYDRIEAKKKTKTLLNPSCLL